MKSTILFLSTCLLLTLDVQAQQAKRGLDIQMNKTILQPGDSLLVTADYKGGGEQHQSLATLELIVEDEHGLRTRLRWPVVKGHASGAIYLPPSLPHGKYTLLAGLQDRFFEVIGKIQDGPKNGSIQAMLLAKSGEWAEQEVRVARDGSFAIRNWLLEEDALIAFSSMRNNKELLDIRISTQLDSSAKPLAVAGRAFYVGSPSPAVRSALNELINASEAVFGDQGSLLPAVVVRTTTKSPAQQFNEEFSSGLFRSADERVVSILDDPSAVGFPNIFSYLQGRVAGLQIAGTGFGGGVARWRGSAVTFFLDEVRVSAQQVAGIPMSDIAIVKAYPPPFIGAAGGGGGIAIYTRRGGEAGYLPANRQVFKVRGYTPSATVLNTDKPSI